MFAQATHCLQDALAARQFAAAKYHQSPHVARKCGRLNQVKRKQESVRNGTNVAPLQRLPPRESPQPIFKARSPAWTHGSIRENLQSLRRRRIHRTICRRVAARFHSATVGLKGNELSVVVVAYGVTWPGATSSPRRSLRYYLAQNASHYAVEALTRSSDRMAASATMPNEFLRR